MLLHVRALCSDMCLTPIYLHKRTSLGRVVERCVPCGKCPECIKKRQSAIVVRSYIESCKRPSLCLFTLTYSDSQVPVADSGEMSLRREDLKNWKKEFRKKISTSDFSWILSGEYGPNTQRPHYHGLFFGLSSSDLRIAEDCWSSRYGFTVFEPIATSSLKDTLNVSRYVSKYLVKDDYFRVPSSLVEPPRLMTSVGFGMPDDSFVNWILCLDKYNYNPFDGSTITSKIVSSVMSRMYVQIGDFKYSVPNYVLRKALYYKSYNGTLCPSPLLQMVGVFKRFRNSRISDKEFQELVSSTSDQRVFLEKLASFEKRKELCTFEKYNSKRSLIVSEYKRSKF